MRNKPHRFTQPSVDPPLRFIVLTVSDHFLNENFQLDGKIGEYLEDEAAQTRNRVSMRLDSSGEKRDATAQTSPVSVSLWLKKFLRINTARLPRPAWKRDEFPSLPVSDVSTPPRPLPPSLI